MKKKKISIYDSLPEGLFHTLLYAGDLQSKESIVHAMRQQRQEELAARRFFQPYEQQLEQTLADNALDELQYSDLEQNTLPAAIFGQQWSILSHLSPAKALIFIQMLPKLAQIVGDWTLTAGAMARILDCPVGIVSRRNRQMRLSTAHKAGWTLGVHSVLGNKIDTPQVEIHIGPIAFQTMRLFEQNQCNHLIINELIALLIPLNYGTTVKYRIEKTGATFRLAASGQRNYLGISTCITRRGNEIINKKQKI
ncbi:hypothetical protein AGMMS4957_16120 [Bacteroidia bacterium]|nr:hypothetical protein AGMMS4957_16120 [Bacteroidia bacterium]